MILVDTSVWVEYDRATESPFDQQLTNLIATGGSEIASTEPVLMEVLAGAKDERRHRQLLGLLRSFNWVPIDPAADFAGAAKIYRACRASGFTPSGLTDCMIANVAIRTGAQVLASDADFAAIARVVPLQLA